MDTQQVLSGFDENAALEVPPEVQPVTFQVAGLGERLLAFILDGIYLALIGIAVGALLGLAGVGAESGRSMSIPIELIYLDYFWRHNGQTPGKRDMGIQIVRLDGQPITSGTVLKRILGYIINTVVLLLGWVAILVDMDRRGWHDRWAGTVVVKKYVGAGDSRRQERGRWRPAIALVGGIVVVLGLVWLAIDGAQVAAQSAINDADEHRAQGDFDAAMIDANKALSLDSTMPEAYVERGMVYTAQGDYQRGTADFDAALDLDPDCALAYFGRGYVLLLRSDHEGAIRAFDEALRLDQNLSAAYFDRGVAHSQLHQRELALADLREYVRLEGDDADPLAKTMIAQLEAQSKSQ